MGATDSKFAGEGQRLGSSQDSPQPRTQPSPQQPYTLPPPPQPYKPYRPAQAPAPPIRGGGGVGGSAGGAAGGVEEDAAKRAAAMAAAERRRQDNGLPADGIQALKRGTQAANANQGALSKELEKQKRGQGAEAALPERVVWD